LTSGIPVVLLVGRKSGTEIQRDKFRLKRAKSDTIVMRYLVDPPDGWRYGFPKLYEGDFNNLQKELVDWLKKNGYPVDDIGREVARKHTRIIKCRPFVQYD
jgi:hypothetical protein